MLPVPHRSVYKKMIGFVPYKGSPPIPGVVCMGGAGKPLDKKRVEKRFPGLKSGTGHPGFVVGGKSGMHVQYVRWDCNNRRYNNQWKPEDSDFVYMLPQSVSPKLQMAINYTMQRSTDLCTNVVALRDGKAFDLGTFRLKGVGSGPSVVLHRCQQASHPFVPSKEGKRVHMPPSHKTS